MRWRNRLLWLGSAVLLVWIGFMTVNQNNAQACAELGGQWSMIGWECQPTRRILLQRGIQRS